MRDDDIKNQKSRRKLLKSIAAGSGVIVAGKQLPESWKRPVVDSVLLPAHATTSCVTPYAGTYESGRSSRATISRCNGVVQLARPPVTIIIGADCSVSVSYTGNRPFTGTGTINGTTFTVTVSRTEDCNAAQGQNDGVGTVSGTVSGTTINGNTSIGGSCDCGNPSEPSFSITGTYQASSVP